MNHAAPNQQKAFGHILGQQYTVFDGLAGMYVEAIYQDRHGLLWIGTTDGGISRDSTERTSIPSACRTGCPISP